MMWNVAQAENRKEKGVFRAWVKVGFIGTEMRCNIIYSALAGWVWWFDSFGA